MKNLSRVVIAILLVIIMATLLPIQVFADTPDYISEVKIAMGNTDSLKGYIVLSDSNNKPIDLNQKSGGGSFSKGEKAVYLGYKTTKEPQEAITDLALMNMNGGYETTDYDTLMEGQIKNQIIPMIQDFQVAIDEYRANLKSNNRFNNQRAEYIKNALNKFIDDDTGKGLGDLLVNETKFEMGDEAYNKLSEEEKKNHADIVTIFAQSNGKATLLLENLITRACDTEKNTWVDRFKDTTYEDLIEATGKSPTDARKELAKLYDDDAQTILGTWDDLRDALMDYKGAGERLNNIDEDAVEEAGKDFLDTDENKSKEEIVEAYKNFDEQGGKVLDSMEDAEAYLLHEYFKGIKYGDGTLLDFFTQEKDVIDEDITVLYPLVAALSDGQRAGLTFVSLEQLSVIAATDAKGYKAADIDELKETSIYDGVDRSIYEKGGVALTSDSLRKRAAEKSVEEDSLLSKWTIASYVIAGVTALGLIGSAAFAIYTSRMAKCANVCRNAFTNYIDLDGYKITYYGKEVTAEEAVEISTKRMNFYNKASPIGKYMAYGFGAVMVIVTIWSITSTISDMKAHYNTNFSPIPKYMVDEKDLIGYNSKGEKIVLKNQSAYYRAVECNRTKNDEKYSEIGIYADMNGDVGSQWLALYSVKNEIEEPILASSLTVQVNKKDIPAGYQTGIHMFGSDTAFNLNSSPYVWNKEAPTVQVYFKRAENVKSKTSGSVFNAGALALAGGAGIIIGAITTSLSLNAKKKKNKAQTA